MADIKQSPLKSLLLTLALAETVWAFIALFFAVKTTGLQGTLDNGSAYHALITTYGFNTVGGYALLLASVITVLASFDLYRGKGTPVRTALWAVFAAALAGSAWASGGATVVSWLPGVPAEIQHAIGSSYVAVGETAVTNFPALAAAVFAAAYTVLAGALGLKSFT